MTDLLPTFPPPPADPGEFLVHFGADIPMIQLDSKTGQVYLKVVVHPDDKWKVLPLSDIRGRRFSLSVYTPTGRRPVLAKDRSVAVNTAREQRKEARRWKAVRAQWFDGVDDDE